MPRQQKAKNENIGRTELRAELNLDLEAAYCQMAADEQREAEALECAELGVRDLMRLYESRR